MTNWVFEHSEEKLGRRLVLLALADYAHDDGSKAFPSVPNLAAKSRMSERQVQENLRQLEKAGSIEKTGRTRAGVNIYRVVMAAGGAESAPAVSSGRGAESAESVRKTAPDPSEPPGTHQLMVAEPEVEGPARSFPLREVDGKRVTRVEAEDAVSLLATFNRLAGTNFKSEDYLRGIVMRLRERPELGRDEHEAVVAATLGLKGREKWWSGRPSPNIVYGNSRAFDRALDRAGSETTDEFAQYAGGRSAEDVLREQLGEEGFAAWQAEQDREEAQSLAARGVAEEIADWRAEVGEERFKAAWPSEE